MTLWAAEPHIQSEFLFPPERPHNHASSLVELPNGDLLAVWYHGSGECTADDVLIQASLRSTASGEWSPRFTIADTPGFPDCNPALFLDSKHRLWLFWPVILANEWHTALLKYRIASDYEDNGHPRWDVSEELLFDPLNFAEKVRATAIGALTAWKTPLHDRAFLFRRMRRSRDKYFRRLGWMPRAHPLELASGRILVPLYSDGFSFSLIAITDDGGRTWSTSEPLIANGAIQPTLVQRHDGSLVAYMRNNGPPPNRLYRSESHDAGVTWSQIVKTNLPNPGSAAEAITLQDGSWALVYNDTERDRMSLAIAISPDEGATWQWTRHLENSTSGQYHYPSLIQSRDGMLHLTYTHWNRGLSTIKYAHFNPGWVKGGD